MYSEFTLVSGHFVVQKSQDGHKDDADDANENGPSVDPESSAKESPSLAAALMSIFVGKENVAPDPDEDQGGEEKVVDVSNENSHSFVSELNDLGNDDVNHPDECSVEHEFDPGIVMIASRAIVDELSGGDQ